MQVGVEEGVRDIRTREGVRVTRRSKSTIACTDESYNSAKVSVILIEDKIERGMRLGSEFINKINYGMKDIGY